MDKNYHDTHKLWAMFKLLIKLFFVIVTIGFSYLLFQDEIQAYINRPQLTQAELAERTKKRAIIRNQEKSENWDLIENGIHVKTGFKNIFGECENRVHAIVTFLGMLELLNLDKLKIVQGEGINNFWLTL